MLFSLRLSSGDLLGLTANFQERPGHSRELGGSRIDILVAGEQGGNSVADEVVKFGRVEVVLRIHMRNFAQKQRVARIGEVDTFSRQRPTAPQTVTLVAETALKSFGEQEPQETGRQVQVDAIPAHAENVRRLHVQVDPSGDGRQRNCLPLVESRLFDVT